MNKIILLLLTTINIGISQVYEIGDQVSLEHQNVGFEVCYGDYPNDSLRLVDFNGNLNGGDYKITFIAIQNGG